jgi:hypothetical protein
MEIELYCDETGTVSSASKLEVYGVGFVHVEKGLRPEVENRLQGNGLNSIHMRKMSRSAKLDVGRALGKIKLEELGLKGGSVIRTDASFNARIAESAIYNRLVDSPGPALSIIEKKLHKQMRARPILTPKDIIPSVFNNARIQEVALQITKFPILQIIKNYGLVDISIHWSAIGPREAHLAKVQSAFEISIQSLGELISQTGWKLERRSTPAKISFAVEEAAAGIYGLSDYIAYTGRMLTSEAEDHRKIGEELYEAVSPLFSSRVLPASEEVRPGIYHCG